MMNQALLNKVQGNLRSQIEASEELFNLVQKINGMITSLSGQEQERGDIIAFMKEVREELLKTGEKLSEGAVETSRFVLERI
jgi:hypothetical protein